MRATNSESLRALETRMAGCFAAGAVATGCEHTVTETAPAIKGATAQAQTKAATLETGLEIQVPAYLESGELVVVDTRDSRFVSRAKS